VLYCKIHFVTNLELSNNDYRKRAIIIRGYNQK